MVEGDAISEIVGERAGAGSRTGAGVATAAGGGITLLFAQPLSAPVAPANKIMSTTWILVVPFLGPPL